LSGSRQEQACGTDGVEEKCVQVLVGKSEASGGWEELGL